MGAKNSRNSARLSQQNYDLATQIFQEIDVDGSLTIEREEVINWWTKNFANINAKAMFDDVDTDQNGKIDFDEWINFWNSVKANGHSDEEITYDLCQIQNHESWTRRTDQLRRANSPKD